MTNFLAELYETLKGVSTAKKPLAVLLIIVFILPIMLFAGFIEFVDLMLQWTWEGVRLTLTPILFFAMILFALFIYFDSIFRANLAGIVTGLFVFVAMLFALGVSIKTLIEWRVH